MQRVILENLSSAVVGYISISRQQRSVRTKRVEFVEPIFRSTVAFIYRRRQRHRSAASAAAAETVYCRTGYETHEVTITGNTPERRRRCSRRRADGAARSLRGRCRTRNRSRIYDRFTRAQ